MSIFSRYLKFHIVAIINIYRRFMFKFDRNHFAFLFNLKSVLIGSPSRIQWDGENFKVTDKSLNDFSYRIRHQRQCDMAYQFGVRPRADSLAACYFLEKVGFKAGDIFLDCGANVGDLKIWFDIRGIDIIYVGFEPSPIEFKCLRENVKPSEVYNIGLWSEEGELDFFISSQGADSSLIEPKTFDQTVKVPVSRLENFVTHPIKMLKLEAEGAEPEILLGLGKKIHLVEFISADLGFERGVACESTLVPVTNFLLERGFELIDVHHSRVCALYRNRSIAR